VVYQNEFGRWCLLESTLDAVPTKLTPADPFTVPGNEYNYQPQFCLNGTHLWSMGAANSQMADYLKTRSKTQVRQKASKNRVF
jgi:hypothetical protein